MMFFVQKLKSLFFRFKIHFYDLSSQYESKSNIEPKWQNIGLFIIWIIIVKVSL